jgi:branched-chain amino acid transport system ATP-binding protein
VALDQGARPWNAMTTSETVTARVSLVTVVRRFGGLAAVNDVTADFADNSITALVGPNGAGKTTVFNLITGVMRPHAGDIRFGESSIVGLRPSAICRLGIARTYQDVRTFSSMTVLDNVAVAAAFGRSRSLSAAAARAAALEVIGDLGLGRFVGRTTRDLNLFERKQVQLARALATTPRVLLLDEQMAGLTPSEMDVAVRQIRTIQERSHLTIILIEHLMSAVTDLAARTVVLDAGRVIADGPTRDVLASDQVQQAYLGRARDA